MARSPVAIQIASDLFEYQEKARSIQMYSSTFDAGIGQIRGELNSYEIDLFNSLSIASLLSQCRPKIVAQVDATAVRYGHFTDSDVSSLSVRFSLILPGGRHM